MNVLICIIILYYGVVSFYFLRIKIITFILFMVIIYFQEIDSRTHLNYNPPII
jgi:hypothetical protein